MHMRLIVICGFSGSSIFFYIISWTARFSGGGVSLTGPLMCVLILYTTLVWNISHFRRAERDIKNMYWSSCNVPLILVRFEWNLNFLDRLLKSTRMSNLMKIRPGDRIVHADGRTDMKLIVAFRNFANVPKNENTRFGGLILLCYQSILQQRVGCPDFSVVTRPSGEGPDTSLITPLHSVQTST
jgi:hypothetical protein